MLTSAAPDQSPGFVRGGVGLGGLARRARVGVLYALCGSLALYPLLEQFIVPVLGLSFLLAASSVLARVVRSGFAVPRSFIWAIWGIYGTLYGVWFGIALMHGNPIAYITQDAFGFLLYLSAMPVLFLYVHDHQLQKNLFRFIEGCSLTIGTLSVLLVAGFYIVFGEITDESMFGINLFLRTLGLSWFVDHNNGLLGLYTNTAHLMLLGSALALHRLSQRYRHRDMLLVLLYLVGMFLDGRRALVITALLQLLIVSPPLLMRLRPNQRFLLVTGAVVASALLVLTNLDWIEKRYTLTSDEDISTEARQAQIPPLLDKIAENPVFGGGFGTVASMLRSDVRPYSYEVDFLATLMKLGLLGGTIYFGTYLWMLGYAGRNRGSFGRFVVSAGVPFFFYMGANGNQAMSTDSAVFHIFIFLMIAYSRPQPARGTLVPPAERPATP